MNIVHASRRKVLFFLVITLSAIAQTQAQQPPVTAPASSGKTPQTPVTPKQQAINLLHKNLRATGLNQSTLDSYLVTDAYSDKVTGDFIVYLQQAYLNIPVYNKIGIYIFRKDSLVEKRPDFISRIMTKVPAKTAADTKPAYAVQPGQAIRFAASHLSIPVQREPQLIQKDEARQHYLYNMTGLSKKNSSSDLVWLPVNDGKEVRLSWNVRIASPDGNQDWYVRVDAQTGAVLSKSSLIVAEKANAVPSVAPTVPSSTHPAGQAPAPSAGLVGASASAYTASFIPPAYTNSLSSAAQSARKPSSPAQAVSAPESAAQFLWTSPSAIQVPWAPPTVTSSSYRVYPFPLESANYGARTLENNPWLKAGSGNNAITLGWHFDNATSYEFTRGNNVWAQEDLNGSSATTGLADTSSTAAPSLLFDQVLDPLSSPSGGSNIHAGIDNLFYWNNLMHDISYQYGFDEAAGNFQASNQGRGGQGNDYVNAFAEDGAGLNNADFATPPDGENPRMRMFQWTSAVTSRLHINSPAAIAIDYTIAQSSISLKNQLTTTGPLTADIVLVNDDASGTTHQACSAPNNAPALAGKIALLDRGGCNFVVKIKNAQNAGAIAVIVVNNVAGAPTVIGGTDSSISIPAVMVSNTDGATLKANIAGLNGTLSSTGENKDGTLDNGVMAHEYTHGISNRLTGGPANSDCLANAEQMGEGWSDYMALMVTTDWSTATPSDGTKARPIGTYVMSQPATGAGIRTYPYSTDISVNPWTYAMLATNTAGEPHTIGEIWCATIWDMTWNIIQQEGIDPDIYHGTKGNNIALQLVLQGMKYQLCSPGFLDARDAILKADSLLYNYVHKCAIWHAFARRGMGKSALQGSSGSYTDQTAAYDLPSGLGVSQTADKSLLAQGDNITYTIKAYCDCNPLTNITLVDTLSANLTYVSSPGGTYTAPYIHFDGVNFAAGETKTFTIQAKVAGSYISPDTLINDSRDPAAYSWTAAATVGGAGWSESTTKSHSPSHAWYAVDQSTPTDFTLTSGNLLLDTLSTLSFWHYFETDPTYDGGVVELSVDGGTTWQDLGPYMTQNPYNSNMDPSATGIGNRKAFAGSSGGSFIQTVIALNGFAGATAKIRFRFTSDALVGDDGWYIDDIFLQNEKGAVSIASAFSGSTLLSKTNVVSLFAPGPLSVNFLSFDATKQNAAAALHWKVNAEIDANKYIVERSADGTIFSPIGEVPSSPASSLVKEYVFTDDHPLKGNNFYRIVEKDIDGKSTISVTRLLRFAGNEMIIGLSPVPTYNHTVKLEIATGSDAPVLASLTNTVGQIIKIYTVQQGTNWLNLENFAPGIYFLKVQIAPDNIVIRKLVIQ